MTNFKTMQGHISPCWDLDFVKNLTYSPLRYDANTNNVKLLGREDQYDKIGFSIVYDLLENYPREFAFIEESFQWLHNKHVTLHRFSPGETAGLHVDKYTYYNNKFNIHNSSPIFRLVIFLEDWKSGHYMEVDGKGYVNWSAGDWLGWDLPTPHLPANLGAEDRHTLQITGTLV